MQDSYKRLLGQAIEVEMRIESKKRADVEAIRVFSENLRELLLSSPLGRKNVLAIDPGFRTGCKIVCLDRQGKLLHNDVIYPTASSAGQAREAAEALLSMIRKFEIEAIAIGNGTASRETEMFVKALKLPSSIPVVMVNESGASIYSASDVAREEFPNHDLTVRGAVSIGRRLMDPLAELVKLDPKSIGVGQYQHDVDQFALKRCLDDVVMSCVNGRWYLEQEADKLAYQVVKYQQRDSWSHGDLLRLAHPKAPSAEHEAVFRWILSGAEGLGERTVKRKVNGEDRVATYAPTGKLPEIVEAFEKAKKASSKAEIVGLINDFDLPREAIPTQWLNEVAVWDALLQRMPITALVRNLGKMTAIDLVKPFSEAASLVVRKLGDAALLKRARIHPLAVLIAQKVYAQGRGEKGSLTWQPVPKIVDALDAAFYATFQNVEPCGKPVLLALDVSGSMDGSMIAGSCLSAREASAAMALVTAATEPDCEIIAFSAASNGHGGHGVAANRVLPGSPSRPACGWTR